MPLRGIVILLLGGAGLLPNPVLQSDPAPSKLRMPPVQEPEWALPATDEQILRLGFTPIPGGGYQFEKRAGDGSVRSGAVVPGRVIMSRGFVELLACGEGGKEHESVLRVDCDIQALDAALSLSGFRKGPVPAKLGEAGPEGARIVALVQWREGDRLVTRRAEDLVFSLRTGEPMPRVGWTYVATLKEIDAGGGPGPRLDYRVLGAVGTRSLMMIRWNIPRDGSTLFDCPLPSAVDGTSYHANEEILPPEGTPVALVFRTPTPSEREEIARAEKDVR